MRSVRRLDPNGTCERENIKVFDGNSTAGSLLGRVCSTSDYVPVFESASKTLTFQVVTDSARIQRTVFIFYYLFSPRTCKFSFMHPARRAPASAEGSTLSGPGRKLESESVPSETPLSVCGSGLFLAYVRIT